MSMVEQPNYGALQPQPQTATQKDLQVKKEGPYLKSKMVLPQVDLSTILVFERELAKVHKTAVWHSKSGDKNESVPAKVLQNILNRATAKPITTDEENEIPTLKAGEVPTRFKEFKKKLDEYKIGGTFFRLTEGKIYEVDNLKKTADVKIKVQIVGGNINWYFVNVGHDETTQEFRDLVFRSASLAHLLVDGACAKYYRGTNAYHLTRMHDKLEEAHMNHNHYRVKGEKVTPDQFKTHLEGFLEAQKRYGIEDKFLTADEALSLHDDYVKLWEEWQKKPEGQNETYLDLSINKYKEERWSDFDNKEHEAGKLDEDPCAATAIDMTLPASMPIEEVKLDQSIKVQDTNKKIVSFKPQDWIKYPQLEKNELDTIAKAGMAGKKAYKAMQRNPEELLKKYKKDIPFTYTAVGELFTKLEFEKALKEYPKLTT